MSLTNDDLQQVGTYVQTHLYEWLPPGVFQLSERIVRVEEELKAQGRRMDDRFIDMKNHIDQRFVAVDQRFVAVDQRFVAVDQRFEDMHKHTNRWMAVISTGLVMLGALMTAITVFS